VAGVERIEITPDYDWLAAWQQFIGASEVATVCGVGAYGSLAELYAEKKGLRPSLIDNAVLRRGRWGESAVFQALSEERPEWKVVRARVHVIDRERRLACTPDGFAQTPDRQGFGIIQAKVVSRSVYRNKWLYDPGGPIEGPASPPVYFRLQTVCERMLNADRCSWAALAVLVNGEFDWMFRLFDVEPDPIIEDCIKDDVAAFWRDHLDAGVMPPFEPQRDMALIKQLYPHDDGTEIDLTSDNRAAIATEELIETQAALKRLEKTESALKTELTAKIGSATFARLADGRRLSWKHQSRKGFTVEPSSFRVFRVLKAEGKGA
jgi:predicted phage-related endonuclease